MRINRIVRVFGQIFFRPWSRNDAPYFSKWNLQVLQPLKQRIIPWGFKLYCTYSSNQCKSSHGTGFSQNNSIISFSMEMGRFILNTMNEPEESSTWQFTDFNYLDSGSMHKDSFNVSSAFTPEAGMNYVQPCINQCVLQAARVCQQLLCVQKFMDQYP